MGTLEPSNGKHRLIDIYNGLTRVETAADSATSQAYSMMSNFLEDPELATGTSFIGAFGKLKQATDNEKDARNQFLTQLKEIWNEYKKLNIYASALTVGVKSVLEGIRKREAKKQEARKRVNYRTKL